MKILIDADACPATPIAEHIAKLPANDHLKMPKDLERVLKNCYYYDQLNKEQQRAYYAMKEGLLNLQDSFAVPMLSKKELSDIYFMIRMDCPEIFYSVTFSYKYYADSTAV